MKVQNWSRGIALLL